MKAVIYARYSDSNQREESIEGQLRECARGKMNLQLRGKENFTFSVSSFFIFR